MAPAVAHKPGEQEDVTECTETLSPLRDFLRPLLLRLLRHEGDAGYIPSAQRFLGVFVAWLAHCECGARTDWLTHEFCSYPPAKVKTAADASAPPVDIPGVWADPGRHVAVRAFYYALRALLWLGVSLGSEPFYITALPFLFWNIDLALGRRVVVLWAAAMYIGQSLKDYFQLPRPVILHPSRVRVQENHWLAEYGFPSTHVMAVLNMAGNVVYFTYKEDYAATGTYPIWWAVSIAAALVLLTAFSRIFVGVHSLTDLVGGLVFGGAILYGYTHFDDWVDDYIVSYPGAMYAPTALCVILLLVYPATRRWTNAYGDTAMISGVCNGCIMGSHLAASANFPRIPLSWLRVDFNTWLAYAAARFLVGVVIALLTRFGVKKVCEVILLNYILPASSVPAKQRYAVIVPTRFVTYTAVGLMATYGCFVVFSVLGLTMST